MHSLQLFKYEFDSLHKCHERRIGALRLDGFRHGSGVVKLGLGLGTAFKTTR